MGNIVEESIVGILYDESYLSGLKLDYKITNIIINKVVIRRMCLPSKLVGVILRGMFR